MKDLLKPLTSESLVDTFIGRFEELILSGDISIGEKLPSERELALKLNVSRPVVHEGLVELEARGLVKMKPRSGSVVNDYRRNGSLTLLNSLVKYRGNTLRREILESLLGMRMLFETETASLSAANRNESHLQEFREIIAREKSADRSDCDYITSLDFDFHLLIAISSGNLVYPLMLNSFKEVYTNFTKIFFQSQSVADFVFSLHEKLVHAIEKRDRKKAVKIMKEIISHGENRLNSYIVESIHNK